MLQTLKGIIAPTFQTKQNQQHTNKQTNRKIIKVKLVQTSKLSEESSGLMGVSYRSRPQKPRNSIALLHQKVWSHSVQMARVYTVQWILRVKRTQPLVNDRVMSNIRLHTYSYQAEIVQWANKDQWARSVKTIQMSQRIHWDKLIRWDNEYVGLLSQINQSTGSLNPIPPLSPMVSWILSVTPNPFSIHDNIGEDFPFSVFIWYWSRFYSSAEENPNKTQGLWAGALLI